MANPPTVRTLDSLIAEINPSTAPMKAQIDADILANQTAGDAQIAGLDAKKTKTFGQIEQAAQNKGMFFSGFSPDEQANYTADTYLPALAQLQQTIASTRSGLMREKIGLDMNVFDKAYGTRTADEGILADWNKMTAQQQFDASEADKQRVWQAQQNSQDRALSASNARLGASGGGGGSSGMTAAEIADADGRAINSIFGQSAGKDGFVSPGAYSTAKNIWTSQGYDGNTFDAKYATWRNPKNTAYNLTTKPAAPAAKPAPSVSSLMNFANWK